jgi:hypothetical protein
MDAVEFHYEPKPDHLLVVMTGRYDADAVRGALRDIVRISREQGLGAILVDARGIRELVPIADRFGLAVDVAALGISHVAVLVTPENAAYTKTFENTATNRGARVKTTDSEAEARQFLGLA